MRIWRVGSGGKPVQISNNKERYLVYLDVTEDDVKQGDWIQVNNLLLGTLLRMIIENMV